MENKTTYAIQKISESKYGIPLYVAALNYKQMSVDYSTSPFIIRQFFAPKLAQFAIEEFKLDPVTHKVIKLVADITDA